MNVCGIDPGLGTTGYAVVGTDGEVTCILDAGIFTTDANAPLSKRLVQLADGFEELLRQWRLSVVGVEQLYSHYKHPRTAIQMAHARGVLLAAANRAGAEVRSFSATHVKRHLTGNGRASKTQVQRTIQSIFNLPAPPEPPDVADAIAIAFCCAQEVAGRKLEVAS